MTHPAVVVALVVLPGCSCMGLYDAPLREEGTDGEVDPDSDLCGDDPWFEMEWRDESQVGGDVDLLFLVDNSNSMREEQANLTANFADLIGALVIPPDQDADGATDWNAVRTLHIGVISTDMGTSGLTITTCDEAERGDDGVLQNLPAAEMAGCDATYPKFLTFDADLGDAPDAVAPDFACIATLGTGGCGFEQQLFAVEKALTVHAAEGAANEGFLRADAVLAILMVTDEEDCSISDPSIFSDDDTLGPLNLRCFNNFEMVRPVDEFVDSILSVKPGHPERIVVSAITGVPPDLVQLTSDQLRSSDIMTTEDFDAILDDPRMIETVDFSAAGGGNRLVPSCDVPGLGVAFPPRRIVELIRDIDSVGNNGLVQSICQADWSDSTRAISNLIGRAIPGTCTPLPLLGEAEPLANGEHADCVVLEILPDPGCAAGRIPRGEDDGQTICQVCQQGDGSPPYETDFRGESVAGCDGEWFWFYTTEGDGCGLRGKIDFTLGGEPPEGALLRVECARRALPEPESC